MKGARPCLAFGLDQIAERSRGKVPTPLGSLHPKRKIRYVRPTGREAESEKLRAA
jgi:hypothetical protein